MAKYSGSPWGEIRGKLGEAVGSARHGTKIIRAYKKPKEKSGLKVITKLKAKKISRKQVDIKSINNNYIFKLMTHIATASDNYRTIIFPVWYHTAMMQRNNPHTTFYKYNHLGLLLTVPNPKKLCNTKNNIDIRTLEFTPEYSGPPIPVNASYDNKSGEVKVRWETPGWLVCSPEDKMYCVAVYFKPKPIIEWSKENLPWSKLKVFGNTMNASAMRKDGSASIMVDKKMKVENLFVYIFFQDERGKYSKTYCVKAEV